MATTRTAAALVLTAGALTVTLENGCSSDRAGQADGTAQQVLATIQSHPDLRQQTVAAARLPPRRAGLDWEIGSSADKGFSATSRTRSLHVAVEGASPSPGLRLGRNHVFLDALERGVHLVQTEVEAGIEDFIVIDSSPTRSRVTYRLDAIGITSARVVNDELQLVDRRGSVRFRTDRPFLLDRLGRRQDISIALGSCASAKGALSCSVNVDLPQGVEYPAVLDPQWLSTSAMAASRVDHSATLLSDGRVLVTGGNSLGSGGLAPMSTCEIYDPGDETWTSAPSMSAARMRHSATLLSNGTVLVIGGETSAAVHASAEIYDPESSTWRTVVQPMPSVRTQHRAALTWGEQVLVVGGMDSKDGRAPPLATAILFDVYTETWTSAASLSAARTGFTLEELPNKKLIAVGGRTVLPTNSSTTEIYDPGGDIWTAGPSLNVGRAAHSSSVLRDGRLLVTGGSAGGSAKIASAEILDPTTNAFASTTAMNFPRRGHSQTTLLNRSVLVAGGRDTDNVEDSETFDPVTGSWTLYAQQPSGPRAGHTATRLQSGRVLVAGGAHLPIGRLGGGVRSSSEIFDAGLCSQTSIASVLNAAPSSLAPSYDLSSLGGDDWATFFDGPQRKSLMTPLLGTLAPVGGAAGSTNSTGRAQYSWTDGTPILMATSGVGARTFSGSTGAGVSTLLPAGPLIRQYNVVLGSMVGPALLRARLTDGSCHLYEKTLASGEGVELSVQYASFEPNTFLEVSLVLLAPGQVFVEGQALSTLPSAVAMFETDSMDPTKTDYQVTVDNPLVMGNVTLDVVSTDWNGPMPEEIDSTSPIGFVNYNADFNYYSVGEGDPASNGTAQVGAVTEKIFASPNATGFFTAGTPSGTLAEFARGLRVGYAPSDVQFRTRHPDNSTSPEPGQVSKTVKLDPNVLLVPIEVALITADKNAVTQAKLRNQLTLWDQLPMPNVFENTVGGELVSIQRDSFSFLNPLNENGQYLVSGQRTPDSVFKSCGVQFRLVSYLELNRHDSRYTVAARRAGETQNTADLWAGDTENSVPCRDNRDYVLGQPGHVPDIPLVIFMSRPTFQDAPEVALALVGNNTTCVNFGSGYETIIAHELGHLSGLTDCGGVTSACRLMFYLGGGDDQPSASECQTIRTWASTMSTGYFPR